MSFEMTTKAILWKQISDLSVQFFDHSGQIVGSSTEADFRSKMSAARIKSPYTGDSQ
jgi:hypothetical protein